MTTIQLGRLESVDLRTAWTDEAREFTPWLAQEDNLALLAETIGLDLELERVEKDVGPYRADILCKDTLTGNFVLIENQLERTDHNHLGQLLTYAAGLNAVTIVWVARRITDEHRAALDWLNDVTGEAINFFGLEIELWRIAGSPLMAPKFNVVSQPNDWKKTLTTIRQPESDDITPTKEMQLDYWTAFHALLEDSNSPVRPRKPRPQHWMTFAIGRSYFRLATTVNTRDNVLSVKFEITDRQHAKVYFDILHDQRPAIEAELGEPLEWRRLSDKRVSIIHLDNSRFDLTDRATWPQQHAWLKAKLEDFYRVFAPRVQALDASAYLPEDEIDTPDLPPDLE